MIAQPKPWGTSRTVSQGKLTKWMLRNRTFIGLRNSAINRQGLVQFTHLTWRKEKTQIWGSSNHPELPVEHLSPQARWKKYCPRRRDTRSSLRATKENKTTQKRREAHLASLGMMLPRRLVIWIMEEVYRYKENQFSRKRCNKYSKPIISKKYLIIKATSLGLWRGKSQCLKALKEISDATKEVISPMSQIKSRRTMMLRRQLSVSRIIMRNLGPYCSTRLLSIPMDAYHPTKAMVNAPKPGQYYKQVSRFIL